MNEQHEGSPIEGRIEQPNTTCQESSQPSFADLIELLCAEVVLDQRLIMAIPGPETPKDVMDALRANMIQGELRRQRIKAHINAMLEVPESGVPEESELESSLKKVSARWPYVADQSRRFLATSNLTEEQKVALMRRYMETAPTLDVSMTLGRIAQRIEEESRHADG